MMVWLMRMVRKKIIHICDVDDDEVNLRPFVELNNNRARSTLEPPDKLSRVVHTRALCGSILGIHARRVVLQSIGWSAG